MIDPLSILFSGESLTEFYRGYRAIAASLPPDLKLRLNEVNLAYFTAYGSVGMYERMNGRTLGQILDDFDAAPPPAS